MADISIDNYAKWLPLLGTPEIAEAKLPQSFIERLQRLKGVYDFWLQFPNKTMNDIVNWEEDMFHIRKSQAYDDIRLVKILLGNLEKSTKDFWRLRINQLIMEQMKVALRKQDTRSLAAMQKNLILNNKTDKDDPLELEYAAIQPAQFEMSDNIDIVMPGRKNISRERMKKIAKKYGVTIEDASYEEIENSTDKEDDGKEETIL